MLSAKRASVSASGRAPRLNCSIERMALATRRPTAEPLRRASASMPPISRSDRSNPSLHTAATPAIRHQ